MLHGSVRPVVHGGNHAPSALRSTADTCTNRERRTRRDCHHLTCPFSTTFIGSTKGERYAIVHATVRAASKQPRRTPYRSILPSWGLIGSSAKAWPSGVMSSCASRLHIAHGNSHHRDLTAAHAPVHRPMRSVHVRERPNVLQQSHGTVYRRQRRRLRGLHQKSFNVALWDLALLALLALCTSPITALHSARNNHKRADVTWDGDTHVQLTTPITGTHGRRFRNVSAWATKTT